MAVTGHNSQTVGGKVEVDTVHHWAQLVLSSGKKRTIDIVGQKLWRNGDCGSLVAHLLLLRILVSIFHGQREHTVLVTDLSNIALLIHIKDDRLFRETLNRLKQVVVTDAEATIAIVVVQLDGGFHHHFAV